MNKTESTLFELIRAELSLDGISDTTALSLKNEEFLSDVISLAEKHDLAHLAAEVLINSGAVKEGDALYPKISNLLVMALYRYEQLLYISNLIYECFEKNGIDYIPLKGSVTRSFYPKPWMRTSCDADILIKKETLDAALLLLKNELGGETEWSSEHDIPVKFKNGTRIELHFTLTEKWFKQSRHLKNIWQNAELCEGTAHQYKLTDETFYLYHIVHAAKHVKNGGCGIKPFIDTYLISEKTDIPIISQPIIKESGLWAFEKSMRELSYCWLNGKSASGMLADFERYVLSGGVYGSGSQTVKSASEEIVRPDRIFLPLSELKYKYKALEKHPALYPIYAVKRIFTLVFCTLPRTVIKRAQKKDKNSKSNERLLKELKINE